MDIFDSDVEAVATHNHVHVELFGDNELVRGNLVAHLYPESVWYYGYCRIPFPIFRPDTAPGNIPFTWRCNLSVTHGES